MSRIPSFALRAALLAVAVASVPAAHADGLQLNAGVGTLGGGLGLATSLGESIGARVGFNALRISRDGTYSGNAYTGKLKFSSVSLLADWWVVGAFRLTAGVLHNANRADLQMGQASIELDGVRYGVDSASAEIDLGRSQVRPYLGLGFASRPRSGGGLGFHFDVGVVPQDPVATLTVRPDASTQALIDADPAFKAEYERRKAQEEQSLRDAISGAKNWPVVTVGLSYSF